MSGTKVRSKFKDSDILAAMSFNSNCYTGAAKFLSAKGPPVSRQLLQYWCSFMEIPSKVTRPKVLFLDIETAPMEVAAWSMWDNFTPLSMIQNDWFILSASAKWLGAPEADVYYADVNGGSHLKKRDDSKVLQMIWDLMDNADVIVTQNGKKFDAKKLNARFIIKGFSKPSPYKHIDTLVIAKREFGFTSNKLEYMTDILCTKYKKLKHGKFAGYELWKECLLNNQEAWKEMKKYNMYDVLSLEELYLAMRGWDSKHPNFSLFNDNETEACNVCGSHNLVNYGYAYTNLSRFQKVKCKDCGQALRRRTTLLTKEKRKTLLMNVGQ